MSWTLVLDPGHGGPRDRGTRCDALVEADYNLRFSRYLAARLWHSGAPARIRHTRTRDVAISLGGRGRLSADANAQLVLSIHVNAGPPGLRGGLVFHWPGDSVGLAAGSAIARALPAPLFRARACSIPATDNPYASDDWLQRPRAVLRPHASRGITPVLVELGYRTHPDDLAALLDPDVQWGLAVACEAGVAEARRLAPPAAGGSC